MQYKGQTTVGAFLMALAYAVLLVRVTDRGTANRQAIGRGVILLFGGSTRMGKSLLDNQGRSNRFRLSVYGSSFVLLFFRWSACYDLNLSSMETG
jgi:hypothetical protein